MPEANHASQAILNQQSSSQAAKFILYAIAILWMFVTQYDHGHG